jgi:hypothetical protein
MSVGPIDHRGEIKTFEIIKSLPEGQFAAVNKSERKDSFASANDTVFLITRCGCVQT